MTLVDLGAMGGCDARTQGACVAEATDATGAAVVSSEPARRRLPAFLAAVVAALVLVAAAAGGSGNREQVRLTAAGGAAARAVVLRAADLGSKAGWRGGRVTPDIGSSMPLCAAFQPKLSDLVVTGAAESRFTHPGLELDSEVEVLRSARMVRLAWQRSVLSPQLLPCLRVVVGKQSGPGATVVSVGRVAFPHVAPDTAALRVVVDVRNRGVSVPVMVDTLLFGRGRTEVTLSVTAPTAAAGQVVAAERRLARLLVSRIRA